jgi:DNA-binding CsgD family transcriptional regulator
MARKVDQVKRASAKRRPWRPPIFKVLESLNECAWQYTLQTREASISVPFWKTLGYDLESLPPTLEVAQTLLHPVDAKLAAEEVGVHLNSSEPLEIVVRVRAADGEWRFVKVRGCVAECDDKGLPAVIGGILDDLTEDLRAARTRLRNQALIDTLSSRERQVLDYLLAGAANKNIAHALGLSPRTIEGYRAALLNKLHAKGTGELMRVALSAGVRPPAT